MEGKIMGKGSGTSVNNVTKHSQRLSESESAGGAGVGGDNSGATNMCLIKFTGIISIGADSPGLRPGQIITLVQGNNAYLDVLSGGVIVGSFGGDEQAL